MADQEPIMLNESLPSELIDLIIDQVADDRVVLNTCSLISRSWLARSRYHLFSDVLITTKNCKDILSMPPPSAFSTAAHRLMLAELNKFPPGVEHFSSVESLYLTQCNAGPDVISRTPVLFSKITSFELNQVIFETFENIVQLVCSLPHLETFTLFMSPWTQESNLPPAHFRLPERLHTLNFVSLRLHVFLEWFNKLESLPPISTVRFYGVDEADIHSIGTSIKRLGGTLQHLTLDLLDHSYADLLTDTIDLSHCAKLLSFTLLNGWPKLLQELLLTHTKHSSLQRASLTIYEGKDDIPNLDLLNWFELDRLVTSPETAFRLTELTIRVYAHTLISTVTRETVESQFLPRSGAKGLVKFVPERQRALERRMMLTSPVARRSWGEQISVEEEVTEFYSWNIDTIFEEPELDKEPFISGSPSTILLPVDTFICLLSPSGTISPSTTRTVALLQKLGRIFQRLANIANSRQLRIIALNRREYPGTTPYTDNERRVVREDSFEERKSFLQAQGNLIALAVDGLIQQLSLPGRVAAAGWSLGTTLLLSMYCSISKLSDDVQQRLKKSVRTFVLLETATYPLGIPTPLSGYSPLFDDKLSPEQVVPAFERWVSSYYQHGDLSSRDIAELRLSLCGYDLLKQPTTQTMTSAELESTASLTADLKYETLLVTSDFVTLLEAQTNTLLFDSQVREAWGKPDVWCLYGEASLWTCIYASWYLEERNQSSNEIFFKSLDGVNHFVSFDNGVLGSLIPVRIAINPGLGWRYQIYIIPPKPLRLLSAT
ncbi:hypothetical protein C0995_002665 [Termitomyces sp. Mi166|nr:hypothetical protein C0995_002665 [Termitomyces sp. Mi166\